MSRLILFNKPYNVLCQFTDLSVGPDRRTLSDYIDLPGVYPARRLDLDSEGLLVLTDDGRLQARIADPKFKTAKTYLVQVEGDAQESSLDQLRTGVRLKDGVTRPADVARIEPPILWPRVPPVRFRKTVADCWLQPYDPGRTKPAGAPDDCGGRLADLRLVRWRVGAWSIDDIPPGEWRDAPKAMPEG